MKSLKLLFILSITVVLFSSCNTGHEDNFIGNEISLEDVVSGYDLWYVDYHKTIGNRDIPYVSQAFTVSFLNGILYANNNIADIGFTGNGLGIDVGTYDTFSGVLKTRHDLDGSNDFEVTVTSPNEIRLYNYRQNITYFLIGYQTSTFDYDKLFYENIEYFLQEYIAWEKINTVGGAPNAFDAKNYLQFTPENITTFYSSQDNFGTQIDTLGWSYVGGYEVFDVFGFENLKILTLNYDDGALEEFELSIINDGTIRLYNLNSETTYDFEGRGFIQYLKGEKTNKSAKASVRNENRKRTKIERKKKYKGNLK
ncbi:MAG: hypothetical protein ACJAVE_001069 [Polaribacter sp.]|jgi:hypothetical protein